MGKRTSKSNSGKKSAKPKGPKGKKARAKAKLERQWGERDDDDDAARKPSQRVGPSRVLHQQRRHTKGGRDVAAHSNTPASIVDQTKKEVSEDFGLQQVQPVDFDLNDDNESISEDENDNEDAQNEDAAHSYANLIHSIRQSKASSQQFSVSMDVDDEDDASTTCSVTVSVNVSSDDDENDEHDELDITVPSKDPFSARFSSWDELPASASASASAVKDQTHSRHKEMVKLNLAHTKHSNGDDDDADPLVDVQVSKHLVETLQLSTTNHKQLAHKFLEAFYRPVVQRNLMVGHHKKQKFLAHHHALLPVLSSYADVLWTTQASLQGGKNNELSQMILAHAVNHVVTSRARIYRHDKRLLAEDDDDDNDNDADPEDAWKRDQGFARPTVLILLPTRHCCYQVVQRMQALLGCTDTTTTNTAADNTSSTDTADQRFVLEYGPPPPPPEDAVLDEAHEHHRQKVLRQKGPAWNALFGDDCNSDDDFKVGLALHLGRKQSQVPTKNKTEENSAKDSGSVSVKLFTDFYRSDIIVASPLGLKMIVEDSPDFLSSIEICVVDRAEVMLEQNWDHVHDVLEMLNQQPRSNNDTDFSRIRPYFLQPQCSQHWRQLVVCSAVLDPAILSTFKRFAQSVSGVVRVKERFPVERASVSSVVVSSNIRQAFQRVQSTSFATQSDDRVNYFMERVLPHLERKQQSHTMIFIPSYFDFLSLRNALLQRQKESGSSALDFVSVTEYARATEVSRGRARFLQGRRPLLLYTGRAHFFLRHWIRGVRHLIFLGLPVHSNFYSEHVNRLLDNKEDGGMDNDDDTGSITCLALYTQYEAHALERIVGTINCIRMVRGEKTTHLFSSS